MYTINDIEYKLKEKYSLKTWGLILKILQSISGNETDIIINLLVEDKLIEILNLILDVDETNKITEVFEEDLETINKIITDFFSRKKSLMKGSLNSITD